MPQWPGHFLSDSSPQVRFWQRSQVHFFPTLHDRIKFSPMTTPLPNTPHPLRLRSRASTPKVRPAWRGCEASATGPAPSLLRARTRFPARPARRAPGRRRGRGAPHRLTQMRGAPLTPAPRVRALHPGPAASCFPRLRASKPAPRASRPGLLSTPPWSATPSAAAGCSPHLHPAPLPARPGPARCFWITPSGSAVRCWAMPIRARPLARFSSSSSPAPPAGVGVVFPAAPGESGQVARELQILTR